VVPAATAEEAEAVGDGVTDAADAADAAAGGVAQAPVPDAERPKLVWPDPISFKPRTNPTTSASAKGTAILAARALWGRADQCALRIQSTSEFRCRAPSTHTVDLSNAERRDIE
jgi:hypothetical protein